MAKKNDKKEHKPYDKILKENIGMLFLPLAEKQLGIRIQKSEELKDKLQTTLEREADFLRKITTQGNETFILHLEFQVADEIDMVYRMQEYHAILKKKYSIPIKQFVYYLGEKPSEMRTQLNADEIYKGFEMRSLHSLSYEGLLNSQIPEEIMLAMLADFGKTTAKAVVEKILQRLLQLKIEPITLEKYLRQMLLLARLRQNLNETLQKQLSTMALTYDIEKDSLYIKGIEKGIEKGELQTKIKGIQNALRQQKLTAEEIADLFEVTIEFVVQIQANKL